MKLIPGRDFVTTEQRADAEPGLEVSFAWAAVLVMYQRHFTESCIVCIILLYSSKAPAKLLVNVSRVMVDRQDATMHGMVGMLNGGVARLRCEYGRREQVVLRLRKLGLY